MQTFITNIEDCITELETDCASTAPGEKFNEDFANHLLRVQTDLANLGQTLEMQRKEMIS